MIVTYPSLSYLPVYMDPCWRSLFYIAVVCIVIVSAQDGGNDTSGIMYPDCVNATCTTSDCETAELDFTSMSTEVYFRDNVICLNKIRPITPRPRPRRTHIYRLTGCPDTFFSTMERTEGVCKNKTSHGIDLFLNLTQTVVGLYDFTCYSDSSGTSRSNYAIIVNDTSTYRDILVFVNGTIKRTANVNINEGENVTIVALVVGEMTLVEVAYLNATGHPRANNINFCTTNKACGSEYSDNLESRDQLCTLTNAAASTDNQTLRFFVRNSTGGRIKLGEVNITVNPPPPSTTNTITTSPTPTSSPTNKDGGSSRVVFIVVPIVVVSLVLVLFIIICLCVYYWYRSTDKSPLSKVEHNGGRSSPDGNLKKLRVLIYSCDHSNIEPLVNKLKVNQEFEVEELINDPSARLSDIVSMLHSEISQGSVLIDCSCPGVTHSTMHTVVKSYTQKPSGDPTSSKWHVIQLNNCETDVNTSPSWSKLYDHVDVIDYSTLDVVLDHVENKLIEYSQSNTSSIHSESDVNISMKQQLLPGQPQRPVGASATNEQIDKQILQKVEGIAQGIESLAAQSASQHNELLTSVEDNKEQSQQAITQLEAIGKDTRKLVNSQTSE